MSGSFHLAYCFQVHPVTTDIPSHDLVRSHCLGRPRFVYPGWRLWRAWQIFPSPGGCLLHFKDQFRVPCWLQLQGQTGLWDSGNSSPSIWGNAPPPGSWKTTGSKLNKRGTLPARMGMGSHLGRQSEVPAAAPASWVHDIFPWLMTYAQHV